MAQVLGGRLETLLGEHPMTGFEYRKYESAIAANRDYAEVLAERIKGGWCGRGMTPEAVERHDAMKAEFQFIADEGLDYEKLCYAYIHLGMVDIATGSRAITLEKISRIRQSRRRIPLVGSLINRLKFESDAKQAEYQANCATVIYWCDGSRKERVDKLMGTFWENYRLRERHIQGTLEA